MLGCDTLGRCQPSRIQEDVVSNWEPAQSLVEDAISGAKSRSPLPSSFGCHTPASLPLRRESPMGITLLWHSLNPCSLSRKGVLFCFVLVFLEIQWFGLKSHVSSLRLSSGHSSLVLTLRTDDAVHNSLPTHQLLVADASIWVTYPLTIAVRHIFLEYFPPLLVMLPSEIPKLPTDMPVSVSYCV